MTACYWNITVTHNTGKLSALPWLPWLAWHLVQDFLDFYPHTVQNFLTDREDVRYHDDISVCWLGRVFVNQISFKLDLSRLVITISQRKKWRFSTKKIDNKSLRNDLLWGSIDIILPVMKLNDSDDICSDLAFGMITQRNNPLWVGIQHFHDTVYFCKKLNLKRFSDLARGRVFFCGVRIRMRSYWDRVWNIESIEMTDRADSTSDLIDTQARIHDNMQQAGSSCWVLAARESHVYILSFFWRFLLVNMEKFRIFKVHISPSLFIQKSEHGELEVKLIWKKRLDLKLLLLSIWLFTR